MKKYRLAFIISILVSALVIIILLAGIEHNKKSDAIIKLAQTQPPTETLVMTKPISTSFNESIKTHIVTNKGSYIVYGAVSAEIGGNVWRNDTHICIESFGSLRKYKY